MRFIQRLSYALLMLALFASVSSGQEATEEPEFISGEANITAVRVGGGSIIIEGTFPDGCTSISSYEWQIEGNIMAMTVYTERPADLMCTQAIVNFEQAITPDVEDIADGDYEVIVNGVIAEETFNPQDVVMCPEPDGDYDIYTDNVNGLCFQVPRGYRSAAAEGQTTITAGAESELEPLPFLAIEFLDLGTPLETYLSTGFNDVFFEETPLNAGTLYTGFLLVGPNLSRIAFLQSNNQVLRLINRPIEDESDEVIAASDSLWATVTESLLFFSPNPDSEAEPTRTTYLEANHLNITVPVNWHVAQDGSITQLTPLDEAEVWLALQPLPDFPEVETPDALLVEAANRIGVDVMNYETLQNDTTKGVVAFPGPEPLCQTIIIWHDGGISQMDVSAAACNEDGTRSEAVNQFIQALTVVSDEE